MDVFIIMQLFRCIPLSHKLFSGEIKSDVLTLLTKVKVRNLLLLHFFRWLYLVRGQFNMYLWHVKRSVICKCWCFCLFDIQKRSVFLKCHFHCHRSFPLKKIQLSVNCYVSIFNFFIHQNVPGTPIWEYITKRITAVVFLILIHQTCCVKYWNIVAAYSYSFGEPSNRASLFSFESAYNYLKELVQKQNFKNFLVCLAKRHQKI